MITVIQNQTQVSAQFLSAPQHFEERFILLIEVRKKLPDSHCTYMCNGETYFQQDICICIIFYDLGQYQEGGWEMLKVPAFCVMEKQDKTRPTCYIPDPGTAILSQAYMCLGKV